jgi:hypothetical protein
LDLSVEHWELVGPGVAATAYRRVLGRCRPSGPPLLAASRDRLRSKPRLAELEAERENG